MDKLKQAIAYFEDAIKETNEIIEDCSPALQSELTEQKQNFVVALDALRRRPAPENKPLTLEQLRQMDGDPVWIQRGKKGTYRVVKDVSYGGTYGGEVRFTDSGPTGLRVEDYCKTWVPYARKLEQEDKLK